MNIKETKIKTLLKTMYELDFIYQEGAILDDANIKQFKIVQKILNALLKDAEKVTSYRLTTGRDNI